jgi:hypothetical protein
MGRPEGGPSRVGPSGSTTRRSGVLMFLRGLILRHETISAAGIADLLLAVPPPRELVSPTFSRDLGRACAFIDVVREGGRCTPNHKGSRERNRRLGQHGRHPSFWKSPARQCGNWNPLVQRTKF